MSIDEASNEARQEDEKQPKESEQMLNTINGLLVSYDDDQLDECVRMALERKSRVRYKCMDVYSNFLAFGTSGGAIYLFRLKVISHSSCTLTTMIPCDQGSIEVIKFLPNPQLDDLLVAIGTSRGSVVVFRLSQAPGELNPCCNEIYKAENFTNNTSIKLMEYDQDLFDTNLPFTKLYICDTANRLYVLESSTILTAKQGLRYFYSNSTPSLVFSVNDSDVNQVSAHRGQLLISTDETTRLFNEQSNQLNIIGKKKRRKGFYGACFFNPNYKPNKLMQVNCNNQQASSTFSLAELESLLLFVSRPVFRLWQVDHQRSVMFTHQFESLIKTDRYSKLVHLLNEPLSTSKHNLDDYDDPTEVMQSFGQLTTSDDIKSDHFEKLMPIYSSTLGNLILSYTKNDLFIVDPIGAKLIVSHHQSAPIIQVCCNENELFIWSQTSDGKFHVERLLLLAPTQFVLELHRVHRYVTLINFVQLFKEIFRKRMALPLSGTSVITTEGGLLRNILLNAWDTYLSSAESDSLRRQREEKFTIFRRIIEEIIEEGNQLRWSIENITDSRFFLTMTGENIDRLCNEPYTSLVSLEVSLLELHSNHVIHFSKEALNRHKSVANLSQNIKNQLNYTSQKTKSTFDLSVPLREPLNEQIKPISSKVIVERQRPRKSVNQNANTVSQKVEMSADEKQEELMDIGPFFSSKNRLDDRIVEQEESSMSSISVESNSDDPASEEVDIKFLELTRCNKCQLPRAGAHLKPLNSSQQRQLSWMEENLIGSFVENIDQIEERSFRFGLWRLYLKCLAFKNEFDNYIACCMALDDVRLLDVDKFVIRRCSEDEVINELYLHLGLKLESARRLDAIGSSVVCYNCGTSAVDSEGDEKMSTITTDMVKGREQSRSDQDEQREGYGEFRFNLINLTKQLLNRRNANKKKVITCLLGHPNLLLGCEIPIDFYLGAIESAVMAASRSQIGRARVFDTELRATSIPLT